MDDIITVNSPTKGIMRVRVEQKKSGEIRFTLLDGISAGYGFGVARNMAFSSTKSGALVSALHRFIMRKKLRTLSPYSQKEIYNMAKDFIEQLGPSGYLDDGP